MEHHTDEQQQQQQQQLQQVPCLPSFHDVFSDAGCARKDYTKLSLNLAPMLEGRIMAGGKTEECLACKHEEHEMATQIAHEESMFSQYPQLTGLLPANFPITARSLTDKRPKAMCGARTSKGKFCSQKVNQSGSRCYYHHFHSQQNRNYPYLSNINRTVTASVAYGNPKKSENINSNPNSNSNFNAKHNISNLMALTQGLKEFYQTTSNPSSTLIQNALQAANQSARARALSANATQSPEKLFHETHSLQLNHNQQHQYPQSCTINK